MKVIIVSFLLFSIAQVFASADDSDCLAQLNPFAKCIRSKVDEKGEEIKKKVQSQIGKCFTKNKCTAPDFTKDPLDNAPKVIRDEIDEAKKAFKDVPDKVKDCFKENFRTMLFDRAENCLKKKHVDTLKVSEQELFEAVYKVMQPDNNTEKVEHVGKAIVTVFVELVHCRVDHGTNAAVQTIKCMKGVKNETKKEICKDAQACLKDSISESCQKRGKEVKTAFCQCHIDKLQRLKDAIEDFFDGKNHSVSDVENGTFEVFRPDVDDMITRMEQCFKDNKVSLPKKMGQVAMGLVLRGQNPLGHETLFPLLFSVQNTPVLTPDQLIFFHRLVDEMIKDHECGCDD